MKKFLFAVTFILLPLMMKAQNINGRVSSSLYTFERYDTLNTSTKYVRGFQSFQLNVNKGDFSLRTNMNLESNFGNALESDPRLRFYNLYLEGRNLFNVATVKLGRQPLFNSVAGGVFDGVNLKLKHDDYSLTGYYGGNVPAYQELKFTDDLNNNYVLGGKFETTALTNFRFALSYIDKNFKKDDYYALRLDENYNPIQVLIHEKSNQFKYVSGEAAFDLPNTIEVNTKYDYDLNFEKTSRFELSTRYSSIKNLGIDLYYNYRAPQISYNSIFSVFNYGNQQEIEGGLDYKFSSVFTAFGKYGYVKYDGDNSQRFTVGVNSNFGSLSYRKTLGYAGELDAVSLFAAHSFMDGLLTPSAGISFTSFKLSDNDPKNNLTSVLAGVNVRPLNTLNISIIRSIRTILDFC